MPRDGSATRTKIMDSAETLILGSGFAATSVDKVIEGAGITKGTFFYHFKSKAKLAEALVQRWADADIGHLQANMAKAEELSRDPLQQMLIFVGLFREELMHLKEPLPGCLFASFCYESELFDASVHDTILGTLTTWRRLLSGKFTAIMELYPPRLPADAGELADMITVIFEGAFVTSRSMNDPKMFAAQLGHYRSYLELLFKPED